MSIDSDFIYDAKERQICGRDSAEDREILRHWARLIQTYPPVEVPDVDERQGGDAQSR